MNEGDLHDGSFSKLDFVLDCGIWIQYHSSKETTKKTKYDYQCKHDFREQQQLI